jgi:hypothetical protein
MKKLNLMFSLKISWNASVDKTEVLNLKSRLSMGVNFLTYLTKANCTQLERHLQGYCIYPGACAGVEVVSFELRFIHAAT